MCGTEYAHTQSLVGRHWQDGLSGGDKLIKYSVMNKSMDWFGWIETDESTSLIEILRVTIYVVYGGFLLFATTVLFLDPITNQWSEVTVAEAGIIFLIFTILTFLLLHLRLSDKDIQINTSRILIAEFAPSATFSFTVVYYTYPSLVKLVTGNFPQYVSQGVFLNVLQAIGSLILAVSAVSWVSLLSEDDS